MTRRICVVVTARPSYARIRTALAAIRAHPSLELQLVVGASALLDRYGNTVKVIEDEGFRVDRKVYMIVEGEHPVTSAKSTGLGLAELATIFDDLRPSAVVTVADRFETIATAIAAAYMNIPLVHVQGGEITGSIDEKVRHAVTKLADVHFVASAPAAERVVRMGERPDRVFVTGCPSIDLAREAVAKGPLDLGTVGRFGGVGARLDLSRGYLVVLQHPVTTEWERARAHVEETLQAVDALGLPTLWFWPNVDAGSDGTSRGIRAYRETHAVANVHFFKNLPPEDFIRLLAGAHCIVGNSSVAIRECSWLGVRAVNVGSRQAGRDRGTNVTDVDYDRDAIIAAVRSAMADRREVRTDFYGDGHAGARMATLLAEVPLASEKRLVFRDDG
ncbi:MAG: UDP-N-acetylglucosamine 2-epimerase (hydrolyzing) [Deltaproteobacteria bacterium]|nr:UDP-N-acetylglucosamine 2-epimerase (hydrolyzing) [Deltaproteobacteria bacterium]